MVGPHEIRARKMVYGYMAGALGVCAMIVAGVTIWGAPALTWRLVLFGTVGLLLAGFLAVFWLMGIARASDKVEAWVLRLQGESAADREQAAGELELFIAGAKFGAVRGRALEMLERVRNEEKQPDVRALMTAILDKFSG